MKKYTKKENALYWTATSVLCGLAIASMLLIYELIEFILN